MVGVVLFMVIFSVNFGCFCCDRVPVLIWSNDRAVVVPQTLAGHTVTNTDFSHLYLDAVAADQKINIAIFVQDRLSLEDITQYSAVYGGSENDEIFSQIKTIMESMSVAQLPSVESPAVALGDLKKQFSASSVHLLEFPYNLSDLSLSPAGHNLIIVKLPETSVDKTAYRQLLKSIDGIVGSVTSQLKALPSPFVALYTASKSSDESMTDTSHASRQLLSTTVSSGGSVLMGNVSGSFFLYAQNMTLHVNGTSLDLPTQNWITDGSKCVNDTPRCEVTLKYSDSIQMMLVMEKTRSVNYGYWFLSQFRMVVNETYLELNPKFVEETPFWFSYHCYKPPVILGVNSSNADVNVTFIDFQIQAFGVKNNKFGYYNDCIGFFTIPIWMGILSSAVMLAILLFGVIMLLDIKTMDRYDDPKGKTITITATD